MTDIVLRMKTLPDLTNEKAWEVVYEGAREIERLRMALLALANAADAVGVKHLDSDDMSDEAVSMQQVTLAARHILTSPST